MSSWPRISTDGWLIEPEVVLSFAQPNILEAYGVAVSLEVDLAFFLFGAAAAGSGALVQFEVVVDEDAIVAGGDAGVLYFFAVLEAGGGEANVVGLPGEGREAHVYRGWLLSV